MKFRELWKLRWGKFLYLWLVLMILYSISLWLIDDIIIIVILYFFGFSLAFIPIWVAGYYIIKKGIEEKGKFIHGQMFEFLFFLFLFCASFFLTFFVNYIGTKELIQLIVAGVGIMFFLVNAICAGFFNYYYGFHD